MSFFPNLDDTFQRIGSSCISTLDGRRIEVQGRGCLCMAQPTRNRCDRNVGRNQDAGIRMPLRYNNDKQKKPLFSRGLSVCRLLFNSFSKLKIDENYKEKRRLFY